MDKLDPCAEKCIFVGYGVNQKGYRCYSPKTHRLFTSMNCDFLETPYYYSPYPLSWLSYTSAATIGNEIQNHSTTSAEASNIGATPKNPIPEMISEEHKEKGPRKYVLLPRSNRRVSPKRYSPEKPPALKIEKWNKAMDDEMKALKKNKTWDQCAPLQGKNPVGCRWIFTVKYKPDGKFNVIKLR
nr:hypothetical protein [Tanacetum cinerariifolium]